MKTLKQLASDLGVKKSTLAVRLWEARIECSERRDVKGVSTKFYNATVIQTVRKYLKDKPIGRKPGRRRLGKVKK